MDNKKKSFIYIIVAGLLWGTSGLFVNALAPHGFSSMQLTATRGAVSFLCMLIYVLISNRALFKTSIKDLLFFLGNGITLFSTAFLYYTAMQMTSVSTAVVLMYTSPILVTIFSVIFLGEKMTGLKLTATGLMIAGCCLVSGIIGGFKFNIWGILLGLLSGVTYSTYNILAKIEMKKGCAPITTSFYGFGFMAIISLSLCKPLEIITLTKTPWIFLMLIGLGIVTFVIPYFLLTLSMKYLPAGTASALSITEPMAATVYGIIFLKQIPDIFATMGIFLIIAAVFLLGLAEGKSEK